MSILELIVPVGLGDLIHIKAMLDPIKSNYNQIKLSFHKDLVRVFHGDNPEYYKILDEFGELFFSEPPYLLTTLSGIQLTSPMQIATNNRIMLHKPNLKHLLCKGNPLQLTDEYIVLTTKVRYLSRASFNEKAHSFWQTINLLSQKYKIVILGERVVEMNQEYIYHTAEYIYGIYDDIIHNIPSSKLIDLTIPALGINSSNLQQIQQDCLIMKNAKAVITLGVGGNFSMATAVANTIGYREDQHDIFEVIYNRNYPDAFITKNWPAFINTLNKYL